MPWPFELNGTVNLDFAAGALCTSDNNRPLDSPWREITKMTSGDRACTCIKRAEMERIAGRRRFHSLYGFGS